MGSGQPGIAPYTYWSIKDGQAAVTAGGMIEETRLSIYVNGREVATLMCSPVDRKALAVGFLWNESVIRSLDEVRLAHFNPNRTNIDIFLAHQRIDLPRHTVLTSGCGGGISFQDLAKTYAPLETDFVTTPDVLLDRMRDLNHSAQLYRQVRGVHTAILGSAERLLITAEDIGRHNTIDKVAGKALLDGIDTRDRMLITSGRISSEMVGKARQMGVPVIASRTAPTSISLQLAQTWQICVVGYMRQNGMRVYTHPWRVGLPVLPDQVGVGTVR